MQKYERACLTTFKINYDEDRVFKILNNGGDINAPDKDGNLIMVEIAETTDDPYFIRTMLHWKADIFKRNKDGINAIDAVFRNGNAEVLKALLEDIPLSSDLQKRYLVCTATKKIPEDDVPWGHTKFEGDTTFLMDAVWFNRPLSVIRQLIGTEDYDLNKDRDTSGWTVLRYAYKNFKTAEYLVKRGADINDRDNDGDMYIDVICECENPVDVILLALKNGANEVTKNRMWDNLISRPFSKKAVSIKAFKLLLDAGVDVNRVSEKATSCVALNEVIKHSGDVKIVKYLIKRGANVNQVDEDDDTPLSSCCGMEYGGGNGYQIAKILIEAGADPFLKWKKDGKTYCVADALSKETYWQEIVRLYKRKSLEKEDKNDRRMG